MTTPEPRAESVNLPAIAEELLAETHTAATGRAARTVHSGEGLLRQTVMALIAGAELGEHASPPEAILQVLTGQIRLRSATQHWDLAAGDLLPIPPERHAVTALADSAFLLTVRRNPTT